MKKLFNLCQSSSLAGVIRVCTLLIAIICTVFTIILTGCNKQIFDTDYSYNKAIITFGNEHKVVEIKSWKDFEDGDQIQITTKDGTSYLGHSSNIILIHEND